MWLLQIKKDFGANESSSDEGSSSDNGAEDDEMDVADSCDDDDNVDHMEDSDTEEVPYAVLGLWNAVTLFV